MKRTIMLLSFLILALASTGCSRTRSVALNIVEMGPASFVQTTAVVSAGKAVNFIDPTSAAEHILVVGQNGAYQAQDGAPPELTGNGVIIQVGQTQSIVFPTAGTYTVTCTIHPSMLVTITVTP